VQGCKKLLEYGFPDVARKRGVPRRSQEKGSGQKKGVARKRGVARKGFK
jgi:hypothetical protein